MQRVRVWDLPVRLTHLGFLLLIPALWWTAENGEMERHSQLGYALLFLLLFRLYWGFAGSRNARFASFMRGPAAINAYLRGRASRPVGHNPLGALSVVALLGLMATQISLGLFAQDSDGLFSGPLSHLISYDLSDAAREWHERLFNLLAALIALHVLAVLYYQLVKRDRIVEPMVTGKKRLPPQAEGGASASWAALTAGLLLSAGVTWWVSLGAPL